MDVTDVLRDRMDAPEGLRRMLTASLFGHVALVVALLIVPGSLIRAKPQGPRNIMTISLSGTGEGPHNGGFTAAAAQPVQVKATPEEAKREPPHAPAKIQEMVMPTKPVAKTSKTPPPVMREAPDEARGRTPTRGAETSKGNAVAFSGAPVVIVGTQYNTSGGTQFVAGVDSTTGDPTTTGFTVRTTFVSGSSNTVTAKCWWVAIGT